ncbi:MAG TPA: GNAT family N-acetyltransferase [Mycobacteriales bacterium]|nr:GNAT family N-acetyltransferase [Mycobacteriales bacterium]
MNSVRVMFDEQIRRGADPGSTTEVGAHVVRSISPGWTGITWSDLDENNADAVIVEQLRRFAGRPWEWKYYSYDGPADLPDRLRSAGFRPEPPEAVMVGEIKTLDLGIRPPDGIRLRRVADDADVRALISLHDEVFGGDHSAIAESLDEDNAVAVIALAGDRPVSAGRLEFRPGTEFAGLWGGGTVPEWRRRGIFRALVACRAAIAAERGFTYLQVDATDQSRPILQRLGFVQLATTTPFVHP